MKKVTVVFLLFTFCSVLVSGQTTVKKESEAKQSAQKDIPPGFKSDVCTMFPDGSYGDCCVTHDLEYYKGEGSFKARLASDKRLYKCVRDKKGFKHKIIAATMYLGVRIGGVPFLPTPFRWGFGKSKIKKAKKKAEAEKTKKDRIEKDSKEN